MAAEYVVSTPTTVSNGGAGNVIDGTDILTVDANGSITTAGNYGVGLSGGANVINNNGTINSGLVGVLISAGASNGNIINNSGTISALGANSTGVLIDINSIENTVNNSGIISSEGFNAFLAVNGTNGTVLNNSGKIVNTGGNPSITFMANDSTLNLAAPSFIGGAMEFNFTGVEITTGRSQSNLWDFSNGNPSVSFVNGGVPYAWAGDKFATIDPTALSAAPEMAAGLTSGVSELVRNNSEGGEFWLKSFGAYSQADANGIYNDYYNFNAGIVGGVSAQINKDFYAGVTLGYGVSNLSVNSKWETSQTVNSKGVLGGFYAKSQIDNFFADFALIGGLMGNDSSRLVNDNLATMGIDYANATYNSWFLAPELRIGVDIASDSDWTLTPSAFVRYSSQATDGYTETGSNANATIGARTTQALEGNVELAASTALESGTLTLAGGLDYRQNIGATTQNVTLLGQNLAMPLSTTSTIIGYASANASFDIGNNMNFDINSKAAFGTNGYKFISGTVGISGKF